MDFLSCFESAEAAQRCAIELDKRSGGSCRCGTCHGCFRRPLTITPDDLILEYYLLDKGKLLLGGLNRANRWVVLNNYFELSDNERQMLAPERMIHLSESARAQHIKTLKSIAKRLESGKIDPKHNVLVLPYNIAEDWVEYLHTIPDQPLCPKLYPIFDPLF